MFYLDFVNQVFKKEQKKDKKRTKKRQKKNKKKTKKRLVFLIPYGKILLNE